MSCLRQQTERRVITAKRGTRELYLNSDGVTDQNSGARRDTAASAVREAVVGHLQQHGLQRIALPAGL